MPFTNLFVYNILIRDFYSDNLSFWPSIIDLWILYSLYFCFNMNSCFYVRIYYIFYIPKLRFDLFFTKEPSIECRRVLQRRLIFFYR